MIHVCRSLAQLITLAAVAACGAGAPATPTRVPFATFPCAAPPITDAEHVALAARGDEVREAAEQQWWDRELDFRARALALPQAVDYVEVTRAMLSGSVRFTDHSLPIVDAVVVRGAAPCQRAHDRAACLAELARMRAALFAHLRCDEERCPEFDFTYALTTRGDTVRAYASQAALSQLLGPIDTPVEAWVVLIAHELSHRYACQDPQHGRHRAVPGGYELITRMGTSSCRPLRTEDFTYRVDRAGRVQLLARRVVESDPERCIVH